MATNPDSKLKKKNGVFYTPKNVAQILSDWAIKTPRDIILEPSFGGCHFIEASKNKLTTLSSSSPDKQLFGCDIDPVAFNFLAKVVDLTELNGNFIKDDFLKLRPDSFPVDGFNVVMGNPPYVSHHNMSTDQIQTAQLAIQEQDYQLDGRASLWAYFVIHSLSFLAVGGRVAWVLPSSLLYSNYSNLIKEYLRSGFTRSLIIYLGERLFVRDGTEEISLILLCEGWNQQNRDVKLEIAYAAGVDGLKSIIDEWESGIENNILSNTNPRLAFLPEEAQLAYTDLSAMSTVKYLGELSQIKIGIVSGANDFFIINSTTAKEKGLPRAILNPVLTRFNQTKGLLFTSDDLIQLEKDDHNCLLVDTTQTTSIDGSVKSYLDGFPQEQLKRTTFMRRIKSGTWHRFNDNKIPDAFFPYMRTNGPTIVLNQARVNCTNSINRLYFNDEVGQVEKKAIAISILSSFSQLSAEIAGRTYGAGVLKLEPSEALRIKILLPISGYQSIDITFQLINKHLIEGKTDQARTLADDFIFMGIPKQQRKRYEILLQNALIQASKQRLPQYS